MRMATAAPITPTENAWFLGYSDTTPSQSSGAYAAFKGGFFERFYSDLKKWRSETAFLSDPDEIAAHPSFRTLVENADFTLDLILSELKRRPSLLVWVLDDAISEQPYPTEAIGDIEAMTRAWIDWGKRNGYDV